MRRYAMRRDKGDADWTKVVRAAGCSVENLQPPQPDKLVGANGVTYLVELKNRERLNLAGEMGNLKHRVNRSVTVVTAPRAILVLALVGVMVGRVEARCVQCVPTCFDHVRVVRATPDSTTWRCCGEERFFTGWWTLDLGRGREADAPDSLHPQAGMLYSGYGFRPCSRAELEYSLRPGVPDVPCADSCALYPARTRKPTKGKRP